MTTNTTNRERVEDTLRLFGLNTRSNLWSQNRVRVQLPVRFHRESLHELTHELGQLGFVSTLTQVSGVRTLDVNFDSH